MTAEQNEKMSNQILLLSEKLEIFITYIKNEQSKGAKRGEYFTHKEEEFKGKPSSLYLKLVIIHP